MSKCILILENKRTTHMKEEITGLYVFVDDFCKLTEKYINQHLLGNKPRITREVSLSNRRTGNNNVIIYKEL